jgi:hypothetical protein
MVAVGGKTQEIVISSWQMPNTQVPYNILFFSSQIIFHIVTLYVVGFCCCLGDG